jgi:hypothetical protein
MLQRVRAVEGVPQRKRTMLDSDQQKVRALRGGGTQRLMRCFARLTRCEASILIALARQESCAGRLRGYTLRTAGRFQLRWARNGVQGVGDGFRSSG